MKSLLFGALCGFTLMMTTGALAQTASVGVAAPPFAAKDLAGRPVALADADGKIAHAYGARTTPHMYVIDPQGTLIYAGAIDSKASSNPADISSATNYVDQALGEAMAGKAVSRATTQAYGCSVKYPSGA